MSCVKVRTANISSSTPPSSAHINMQRAQKRGADDEAIGRSRGGPSTKINAVVDALGNPLRFILTGGQVHDSKQAEALIDGFDFDKALADKGYDSDRFRAVIALKGAEAVIPSLGLAVTCPLPLASRRPSRIDPCSLRRICRPNLHSAR
jgi:transposase